MLTTPKAGSISSAARPRSRRTSSRVACSGASRRVTITPAMSPPGAAGPLDPGQGGGQALCVDHAPAEVVVEAGPAQVLGRLEQQGPQLGRGQHRGRVLLPDRRHHPVATGQAAEVPPSAGYTPDPVKWV